MQMQYRQAERDPRDDDQNGDQSYNDPGDGTRRGRRGWRFGVSFMVSPLLALPFYSCMGE